MDKKQDEFGLGNIFPTQKALMDHLAEYGNLTNDDIVNRTSNNGNVDAEAALTIMLERDFCKSAINNIIEKLGNLSDNK